MPRDLSILECELHLMARLTCRAVNGIDICPSLTDFSREFKRAMVEEATKISYDSCDQNRTFSAATFTYCMG